MANAEIAAENATPAICGHTASARELAEAEHERAKRRVESVDEEISALNHRRDQIVAERDAIVRAMRSA